MATCFLWVLGDFDLDNMLKAREAVAVPFFLLFEIMMVFICLNMFLATMLNTYSETRGKLEIIAEQERVAQSRESDFREVHYSDKEHMKGDFALEKDSNNRVWVVKVKEGRLFPRRDDRGSQGEGAGDPRVHHAAHGASSAPVPRFSRETSFKF